MSDETQKSKDEIVGENLRRTLARLAPVSNFAVDHDLEYMFFVSPPIDNGSHTECGLHGACVHHGSNQSKMETMITCTGRTLAFNVVRAIIHKFGPRVVADALASSVLRPPQEVNPAVPIGGDHGKIH